MAATDATRATLSDIDDQSLWVVTPGVPVFTAHKRRAADGSVVSWSKEELPGLAERVNRKEHESGVLPVLCVGHRKPNLPETEQPPIVGVARNWRVGQWGPKGEPGLLCDFYVRKDKAAAAEGYPFRSVEIYPSGEITAVAFLRRDPQLDLGMMPFAKGEGWLSYERQGVLYFAAGPADAATAAEPESDDEFTARFMGYMKSKFPRLYYEAYPDEAPTDPTQPIGSEDGAPNLDAYHYDRRPSGQGTPMSDTMRALAFMANNRGASFQQAERAVSGPLPLDSQERFDEVHACVRQHERAGTPITFDRACELTGYDKNCGMVVCERTGFLLDLKGAAPSGRTNDDVVAANQSEREALAEQVAVHCGLSMAEAGRVVERSRQTGASVLECFRSMFPASYDLADRELLRALNGAYVK